MPEMIDNYILVLDAYGWKRAGHIFHDPRQPIFRHRLFPGLTLVLNVRIPVIIEEDGRDLINIYAEPVHRAWGAFRSVKDMPYLTFGGERSSQVIWGNRLHEFVLLIQALSLIEGPLTTA